MSLYEIRDLRIDFPTRLGTVEAVRGVTFEIGERECVALVGESSAGRSNQPPHTTQNGRHHARGCLSWGSWGLS